MHGQQQQQNPNHPSQNTTEKMMKCFLVVLLLVLIHLKSFNAERWIARGKVHYGGRSPITPSRRSPPSILHSVTFYIKLRNMDKLKEILYDVSDPKSVNYGKHWTREQIAAFIANEEGSKKVEAYLKRHQITIMDRTRYGEFMTGWGRIEDWERVFHTEFHEFEHSDWTGEKVYRALEYSLSEEINEEISSVFKVVDLPVELVGLKPVISKIERPTASTTNLRSQTTTNPIPGYVNPPFLIGYYGIETSLGSSATNQGAIQCIGQYMSSTDLSSFQTEFGLPVDSIGTVYGGHVVPNACATYTEDNCIEANLDFQYITSVGQNIPTVSIYVNSSCDWVSLVQFVQELSNPPKVLSMSYGGYESDGGHLFASSGDDGAVGYDVTTTSECDSNGYGSQFPVTSPYVTAVGATQGPENNDPEVVCENDKGGLITSGGGFSLYEAIPSWQQSFVSTYFSTVASEGKSPVKGYGSGRGYPDISALGHNYVITVSNELIGVSGTSASSPVMAGMFALINAAREKAGLSPLGYLNPFLYQNYASFVVDITSGANFCTKTNGVCCPQGFYASTGWDPVTGLGVINFPALLAVATYKSPAPTAHPTLAPTQMAVAEWANLNIVQEIDGISIDTFLSNSTLYINTIEQTYASYLSGVISYNFQSFTVAALSGSDVRHGKMTTEQTGVNVQFTFNIDSTQPASYYQNLYTSAITGGAFTTLMQQQATRTGAVGLQTATTNTVTVTDTSGGGGGSSSSSSSSNSIGLDAGVAVAVVVVVLIAGLVSYFCFRRYCGNKAQTSEPQNPSAPNPDDIVPYRNNPLYKRASVEVTVELSSLPIPTTMANVVNEVEPTASERNARSAPSKPPPPPPPPAKPSKPNSNAQTAAQQHQSVNRLKKQKINYSSII